MSGVLTLVPTPIDSESLLIPETKHLLEQAYKKSSLLLVEEHKAARRRWLHWGLPREAIEHFVLFNEHNQKSDQESIIKQLLSGKDVYLQSDCGLPAFCDPGQKLVDECHHRGIAVNATGFYSAPQLALALSGFESMPYTFYGFLPARKEGRDHAISEILHSSMTSIVMDTPYRLNKLLEEMARLVPQKFEQRLFFLACDLNKKSQYLYRATIKEMQKKYDGTKREFVLVMQGVAS